MAAPQAPILVLRDRDDAVSAFSTKEEAVEHFASGHGKEHGLGDDGAGAEFFDSRGRRLEPVVDSDGDVRDLRVSSEERHTEKIRQRVRRRAEHVRKVLDDELIKPPDLDDSPLTLVDEDVPFEVLTERLADFLRPARPGDKWANDSRGWWHNTFCH